MAQDNRLAGGFREADITRLGIVRPACGPLWQGTECGTDRGDDRRFADIANNRDLDRRIFQRRVEKSLDRRQIDAGDFFLIGIAIALIAAAQHARDIGLQDTGRRGIEIAPDFRSLAAILRQSLFAPARIGHEGRDHVHLNLEIGRCRSGAEGEAVIADAETNPDRTASQDARQIIGAMGAQA